MCDGCICIILLFLSKISCYQHIHADTDPDRRCIHQCCNRECQRNSDQCILTQPCHKRAVYQVIGILQEHGNQRRYRHLPDEFSNRSDRHFIIGLHTFPPLHKVSGAKNCAGQRDIKSERYSFVCVLRVDRLPWPDSPMQSPRRHARFPVASTPAGEPCHFHCQKSHVPDVPIQFPAQGHGRRASCFRGLSFRPPQRYLRSHLPKLGSRQVRHNKGLCCSPSLLRLVLQSPAYIWGL